MAAIPREDLIKMLEQVILDLKADDSFEGSLRYSCIADHLDRSKDEFECSWFLRYGNSEGQGMVNFLKPSPGEDTAIPPNVTLIVSDVLGNKGYPLS